MFNIHWIHRYLQSTFLFFSRGKSQSFFRCAFFMWHLLLLISLKYHVLRGSVKLSNMWRGLFPLKTLCVIIYSLPNPSLCIYLLDCNWLVRSKERYWKLRLSIFAKNATVKLLKRTCIVDIPYVRQYLEMWNMEKNYLQVVCYPWYNSSTKGPKKIILGSKCLISK